MHASLESGVYFLEEATSSSFGEKTLFNVYANRVRAVTAYPRSGQAPAKLQGFKSEIR